MAHEELQEMADDRQRRKKRVAVRKGKADPELTWQRGRRKTAEGLEWHMKNCKKWQMTNRDGSSGSKEERKSEASAREVLKKCGQRCDGGVHLPPSRSIQFMVPYVYLPCSTICLHKSAILCLQL